MVAEVKKILLVEDNQRDVELTLEALARHNTASDVEVARDGQEALDYLNRRGRFAEYPAGQPAVILLDLKLPKLDGFEVLRQIRSSQSLRLIPVVMLTSSREERDLAESYRLGVNAYVVKPVDFPELVEAVRGLGLFWAVINQPPPGCRR